MKKVRASCRRGRGGGVADGLPAQKLASSVYVAYDTPLADAHTPSSHVYTHMCAAQLKTTPSFCVPSDTRDPCPKPCEAVASAPLRRSRDPTPERISHTHANKARARTAREAVADATLEQTWRREKPIAAMCVRNVLDQSVCNSQYFSQLAAFFIDPVV